MPDIITKGILPKKDKTPLWVGKQFTCSNCKCEFKLRASDKLTTDGKGRHIVCPTKDCGKKINVPVYRGEQK